MNISFPFLLLHRLPFFLFPLFLQCNPLENFPNTKNVNRIQGESFYNWNWTFSRFAFMSLLWCDADWVLVLFSIRIIVEIGIKYAVFNHYWLDVQFCQFNWRIFRASLGISLLKLCRLIKSSFVGVGGTRMKQSFKARILEFGFGISRQYPLIGRGSVHQSCYVDLIKVISDVVNRFRLANQRIFFAKTLYGKASNLISYEIQSDFIFSDFNAIT